MKYFMHPLAALAFGGPAGRNTAAHIVVFNLSWLLDGRDIAKFLD